MSLLWNWRLLCATSSLCCVVLVWPPCNTWNNSRLRMRECVCVYNCVCAPLHIHRWRERERECMCNMYNNVHARSHYYTYVWEIEREIVLLYHHRLLRSSLQRYFISLSPLMTSRYSVTSPLTTHNSHIGLVKLCSKFPPLFIPKF